ncbi:MAG: redox-regulated ATPase YchF [Candidatus Krumholzibacteriota bacterium]|nr:redox-regulated ATPase YchF [Candidatus Krumholzibacteriota bacterium]
MALTVGIVGLPNVGKSTLLNALADAGAEASNYPFCTIDCNRGVVPVPDERLETLASILQPKEVIPATITFVDIAGLVEGASRGEGLGNRFLHHVREANALAHVLRCFADDDVSHVSGTIDPLRDLDIVDTELFLADLERVESRIDKELVKAKAKKKEELHELEFLRSVRDLIAAGERIDETEVNESVRHVWEDLRLLTAKPRIIVLNAGEEDPTGASSEACRRVAGRFGEGAVFVVSAKLEREIAALPPGERGVFIEELGVGAGARERFILKCHDTLGLVRYYTAANDKLQAWSVPRGTTAPRAAGKIHTDMESGFIRAKVMSFEDLVACGSEAAVRTHGHLRTEGHEYVVKDGDVIEYLFNR